MIIEHILNFLKTNFKKRDLILIAGIISLFIITRIVNIEKFPIFNDEGIYIQWAKTAWHDASWRFISLTDGKQPLQTWGTIPLLKLFPNNALLAGRLFAVVTGFVSLVGIFSLLFYLFNKKTAYIGLLLYIFTPYFLFYDRLALSDSGVNAAFIWVFFFSILLAKTIRLDIALLFGMIGGIAVLTKSSAQVFIGLAFMGPLLFLSLKRPFKKNLQKAINYYALYLVVIFISFVIYNVQRLSPFLHFVTEKNKVFLLSFSDFIQSPFMVFFHNISTLPLYVFWEMGFVMGFLGLIGWFLLWKKDKSFFLYFSAWLVILYIGVSFFTRILFPRYLIFFSTLFLITTAFLLSYLKGKKTIIMALMLFLSFFVFDYYILFDIKGIPFPPVDRGQYLEGWTAGWGVKEIMEYARARSKEKPVVILAEGDFGMTGDVLNVYLRKNDHIFIKGYWPLSNQNIIDNLQELQKNVVLVVISHQNSLPINIHMKLIKRYDKPGNKSSIYLLELTKGSFVNNFIVIYDYGPLCRTEEIKLLSDAS